MDPVRILPFLSVIVLGACVLGAADRIPTGAQDYADYCAACHGPSGKGDGELATTLANRPADLTLLSRGNGGTFPTTPVMAKIWGYSGLREGGFVMPNFGPLLDGELVPYDGGDGILTPTPIRLVQIAEHLRTIQER